MRQNTPQKMDQEKFYATEERAEFLPEIVSYKPKQRDDVSVGRIQRFFSGWSESLPYIKKSRNLYLE